VSELGVKLGAAKSYEKKVETVMVNNSTNINKTNNHLSPQIIEHMSDNTVSKIIIGHHDFRHFQDGCR
jgi:hypothetical protein